MTKNKKQKQPGATPPSKGILTAAITLVVMALILIFWKIIPSYSEEDLILEPLEVLESRELSITDEPVILEDVASPLEEVIETEELEVVATPTVKKVLYVTAENFVNQYFQAYNEQDFEKACAMMDQDKCNADRPNAVFRFAEEYGKMEKGYETVRLWKSQLMPTDFHSQVVCVENKYRYRDDLGEKEVIEIMSFYVAERENGTYEISSRVCESKALSDGREGVCPLEAVTKFCVGE